VVEAFNGTLRRECLTPTLFTTREQAQFELETWRTNYNNVRPHSSLRHVPPTEFRTMHDYTTDRQELLVSRA
jgi:putative transposase